MSIDNFETEENGTFSTAAGCEFLQFTDQTVVVADLKLSPIDTTKTATYYITAVDSSSGVNSYDEGQSALFSLVTTNLVAGTAVAYTLSGISESDLESGSLTGTAVVGESGTTVISIPLAADTLTEGAESLTITLDDSSSTKASVIINDTSKAATYSINSSADSYDEGQSALFSLVTANLAAGTFVAYTLSGISESDLKSGSLTGTAVVGESGTTVISIPLAADTLTEGAESLTISLDDSPDTTASLTIMDTSISSSYKLSVYVYDSRDEGSTAYFDLVASGIDAGTVVAYTISGVSASDLVSSSLNGTITTAAAGESKLISIPIRKDNLTEGSETLTITLDDSPDTIASLVVNDTSKNPVIMTTTHLTSILVDEDVLGASPLILQGLTENIEKTDGVTTSHVFSFNGSDYDYDDISPFIMIVVRDNEFTDDFRNELADFAPEYKDLSYQEAVDAVGLIGISPAIITVAGADGNYIG